MKKKEITPFNAIIYDINERSFKKYDVMPYLIRCYDESKKNRYEETPKTFEQFKEFVKSKSMYQYWARCEYEVILSDWPPSGKEKKVDIHWQLMLNHDLVTRILMENVGAYEQKKGKEDI